MEKHNLKKSSQQIPNYQISGMQSNYTYNGVQNLNLDTSSIPQAGYADNKLLTKAVNDQQQFVNNYNNYKSSSTFNLSDYNSSNLENLRDHSQYNIEKGFESAKPITKMLDTKYQNNTIYANLNENLMKESIMEVRLNIDSVDRDIRQYPDPFNYVVTFGPIVNSGISSTYNRTNIKSELKENNKNKSKKNISNQINNNYDKEVFNDNGNLIVDYTDKLKRIFNPYITRDFDNVKFIRLDNVVLPRFDCLKLNDEWDFCKDETFNNSQYIKDDYERIKKLIILNNRYIPDDNLSCSLFTDRFIQIYIKEIENNYNLGTNAILTKAFTVFPDKQVGILYWRGNPYYAVKTYKDSLLGIINRLSIQFYDSWGKPITLNMNNILYEKNYILNIELINPDLINFDIIKNTFDIKWIFNKMNEIIKAFIIINHNIKKKIPFYNTENLDINYLINSLTTVDNYYPKFFNIILNKSDFNIDDIYTEFNDFVSIENNGFFNSLKIKKNKKIYISIDDFINNVVWFNHQDLYKDDIMFNLETLINNYKSFGFKTLNKLKIELINIPLNPYFQNHLTFVMGMYTNELNTKIDFYQ